MASGLQIGVRQPLTCGAPFKGVLDLLDPNAVPPAYLRRARNMFLPNPGSGTGFRQRPGCQLMNPGAPMADSDTGRIGQGGGVATIADGTKINFLVVGGRLFRTDLGFTTFTDVTPGGVTIDPGARVYLTAYSNRMFVTDDVNTPWVASDLQSTPVTATLVDYEGDSSPWRAYGPARVYDDAGVFVVRFNRGAAQVSRIGWCETDDPFTGYHQTNFDDEWDVVENNTDAIYALNPKNAQLEYFRGASIGYASGTIGVDFQSTSAKDGIDDQHGTRAPASLVAAGTYTYFVNAEGKVCRYNDGGKIEEIWRQLARVVTLASTEWHDVTARTACGALVPELGLVVFAIWSPDPTQAITQFATTLYAFDAATGRYVGEWLIGAVGSPIAVHAIFTLTGVDGQPVLAILGTDVGATTPQVLGAGGFLWILGSEGDGLWTDNGDTPDVSVTTPPLGHSDSIMLNVDEIVAIVEEAQTDSTPAVIDILLA